MRKLLLTVAVIGSVGFSSGVAAQTDLYVEIGAVVVDSLQREGESRDPSSRLLLDLTPRHETDRSAHAERARSIHEATGIPTSTAGELLGCDFEVERSTCRVGEGEALLRLGELRVNGDEARLHISLITEGGGLPDEGFPAVHESEAFVILEMDEEGRWSILRFIPTGVVI